MNQTSRKIGELVSLPRGGGSVQGLGEKFAPDLHTGTGNFSIPISVPCGRSGLQPQLELAFSTGHGNGPFGLGWSLSVPGISRQTAKGVPRYGVDDTFVLSGAEDLIELRNERRADGTVATSYRPRTEGRFARITHLTGDDTDHWEVSTTDGTVSVYGSPARLPNGLLDDARAVVADPHDRSRIFTWRLTETRDVFGNRIVYQYERHRARDRGHEGDQLYLRWIRYVDLDAPEQADFLISIELLYELDAPGVQPEFPRRSRPDAFSDYRAGFEIRTARRCTGLVVRTHPSRGASLLVRAYEFRYLDEQTSDEVALPLNEVSLLSRIDLVGYTDDGLPSRELPPLEFAYSEFAPNRQKFFPLTAVAEPIQGLADPNTELVDLFGHGLPDLIELGAAPRYWRNLGGGRFDRARGIPEVPAGLQLSDQGVQLIDANGDGRADLLVTTPESAGYYPLDFRAGFSTRSFQRYPQAPSFDLEESRVRLIDLTGDGVTDVLRSGTSFECYFNHSKLGWSAERTARIPRASLELFPNVDFSDARVKFADLSGDGLQDIAVVYRNRIDYWPNVGYGRWAARITTELPRGLPFDFDPKRVLLSDIDGDGLADLIHVSDREVTLWINCTGNGWSDPVVIRGTPAVSNLDTVRVVDLLGNGVGGILWSHAAEDRGRSNGFFLDLTGGVKPYLLQRMRNNLGAQTEVSYAASTKFYLRDSGSSATRWRGSLPFPVQVVERVTTQDALSLGTLTTEYRYHHGHWDGEEREFRGFGMVEQLDTEVFDGYTGRSTDRQPLRPGEDTDSPPLLTRTWFHQGPVTTDDGGHWREPDYSDEYWNGDENQLETLAGEDANLRRERDAQRSLRGSILRSEVYALDGSALEDRPYSVTEHAYDVREEEADSSLVGHKRIFFPHAVAQRATQWERGADPMTRYEFHFDHDQVGQPTRELEIACPRGTRRLEDVPAESCLATLTCTLYASTDAGGAYLWNRVARIRRYQLLQTAGLPVGRLLSTSEGDAALQLLAESLNYYDGTTDGAFTGLPFARLGAYGALVRTEALVLTQQQLEHAHGEAIPSYLDPNGIVSHDYPEAFIAALPKLAGYVYKAASRFNSPGYFAVTLSRRYDFHGANPSGRGLLQAERDPLGHETTILAYDAFDLLATRTSDAAGFETQVSYNLRTLRPERVTDPNGNVTRVAYSPIGLVTDTWACGKPDATPGDVANRGDREQPSVHIDYELRAFYDARLANPASLAQPIQTRIVRRVFRDSDPDDTGATLETREYRDGLGRVVQTRTQAESVRFGDASLGGGDGVLPLDQDSPSAEAVSGSNNDRADAPNVVVSGWQQYDNKGRVVRKFEPFFDTGWSYVRSDPAQAGRAIRMYYDARGQITRTVNPNGSEQLVVHGVPLDLTDPPRSAADTAKYTPTVWEAYTYDVNDNAGRTHAGLEPHARYSHHYDTPSSVVVDALGRTLRAVARTRSVPTSDDRRQSSTSIEQHVTRSSYDIDGNLRTVHDALGRLVFAHTYDLAKHVLRVESIDAGVRTCVFDAAGRPIERRDDKGAITLHAHDMLDRATRLWARDAAGAPITLRERLLYDADPAEPSRAAGRNLRGRLFQHWDEAGVITVSEYCFEGRALTTQRQVLSDDFMLQDFRSRASENDWVLQAPRIDWAVRATDVLDERVYRTRTQYDALGRAKWAEFPTCAGGQRYRMRPSYDRAGALEALDLEGPLADDGRGPRRNYIERIAYNAKGQRTLVAYGNGLITRYAYEPQTFRLARLRTDRLTPVGATNPYTYQPHGAPLQDLAYQYDLAGNLLRIIDRTPGCGVASNADALALRGPLSEALLAGDALLRTFEYDPLYRLTAATGREAKDIAAPRPWSDVERQGYDSGNHGTPNQDNAPNLAALYSEEYAYDAAGNLLRLRHSQRSGTGSKRRWSRAFGVGGHEPDAWQLESRTHVDGSDWPSAPGNHLTHVQDQADGVSTSTSLPQSHFYDANGNLVREHLERHFEWDHADRLKAFRNQVDASRPTSYALYVYDATGQRVKQLVVAGNRYRTTTYAGPTFEHHREYDQLGGALRNESESLHVVDGVTRIAIQRVGPPLPGDGAGEHAIQYHHTDHLGSTGLVVSENGAWINREEFYPYGETSFGSFGRKRYRFTGKERDAETGLSYHGARYYAAWLARWIACDPIDTNLAERRQNTTPETYAYASHRPMTLIDEDGRKPRAFYITISSGVLPDDTYLKGMNSYGEAWAKQAKAREGAKHITVESLDDMVKKLNDSLNEGDTITSITLASHGTRGGGVLLPSDETRANGTQGYQNAETLKSAALRLQDSGLARIQKQSAGARIELHACQVGGSDTTVIWSRFFGGEVASLGAPRGFVHFMPGNAGKPTIRLDKDMDPRRDVAFDLGKQDSSLWREFDVTKQPPLGGEQDRREAIRTKRPDVDPKLRKTGETEIRNPR